MKRILFLALLALLMPCFASAATFTYDNLNRLTEVTYDNGSKITYAYDAAGNILSVTPTSTRTLASLAITGPATLASSAAADYAVTATYDDASTSTVPGSLSLATTTYASLIGNRLTANTVVSNQSVTLNASYTENSVTRNATLPVTILASGSKTLTSLAIGGPGSLYKNSSGSYSLLATYSDASVTTVAGSLTLSTTPYASLTGTTLTVGDLSADQSVTLNGSYTENSINKTATKTVTLINGTVLPAGTVNVLAGWNLLGNGSGTAIDVATTLADATKIRSVWKWNAQTSRWAFHAPAFNAQQLADYVASKNLDALTTIAGGEGFWINAQQAFNLSLPTASPVTAASFKTTLRTGWNLIGIGEARTPSEFNIALSATAPPQGVIPINITSLWAWDAAQARWYFYAPSLEADNTLGTYTLGHGYLDFIANGKTLGMGVGAWVNKP